MMWDEVMARIRAMILADATLSGIFGTQVRQSSTSGDLQVPGIEWTMLSDVETELWAPMLVQFDCWTTSAVSTRLAERRLRAMFHKNTPITIDGVRLFAEYSDGANLATPDRANFTGRGVRFRFTPLRQQYALPAH